MKPGEWRLKSSPFAIDAIIEDVAGLFAEHAREKGLALAYTIDPGVPAKFTGDAARLTQVVTNLVNNALKFTETGGVVIQVSSSAAGGDNLAALSVKVRDTGIGIAPEKLEHVFERFTQADQSITRRFGGTGLGLAISKRLVEAMDGRLTVDSQEGAGSVFAIHLELPLAEAIEKMPSLSGRTIILGHANPVHRNALKLSLQKLGAIVTDMPFAPYAFKADAVLTDAAPETVLQRAGSVPLLRLVTGTGAMEGGLESGGCRLELDLSAQPPGLARACRRCDQRRFPLFRRQVELVRLARQPAEFQRS